MSCKMKDWGKCSPQLKKHKKNAQQFQRNMCSSGAISHYEQQSRLIEWVSEIFTSPWLLASSLLFSSFLSVCLPCCLWDCTGHGRIYYVETVEHPLHFSLMIAFFWSSSLFKWLNTWNVVQASLVCQHDKYWLHAHCYFYTPVVDT